MILLIIERYWWSRICFFILGLITWRNQRSSFWRYSYGSFVVKPCLILYWSTNGNLRSIITVLVRAIFISKLFNLRFMSERMSANSPKILALMTAPRNKPSDTIMVYKDVLGWISPPMIVQIEIYKEYKYWVLKLAWYIWKCLWGPLFMSMGGIHTRSTLTTNHQAQAKLCEYTIKNRIIFISFKYDLTSSDVFKNDMISLNLSSLPNLNRPRRSTQDIPPRFKSCVL